MNFPLLLIETSVLLQFYVTFVNTFSVQIIYLAAHNSHDSYSHKESVVKYGLCELFTARNCDYDLYFVHNMRLSMIGENIP